MAIVKVVKVETTQVAGGAATQYGLAVSIHSETEQFSVLADIELDTSTMSEADAATVNDFLTLVNERLAAS